MDIQQLNNLWEKEYTKSEPRPERLRQVYSDRWIRFHYLPESKRYPESEKEYQEISRRHTALLEELNPQQEPLFVVMCDWADLSTDDENELLPGSIHWQSFVEDSSEDSEDQTYRHLFVSEIAQNDDALKAVFRAISDDEISGVIVMPGNLSWLYCPYDGGVDIILPSTEYRNKLKAKHQDWLSDHSEGL